MIVKKAWHPKASLANLQTRAKVLARIRAFFADANILEVETPSCSIYATTDPAIESFNINFHGPGYAQSLPLYLHTSPEYAMKRLLAAGSGSIYQICKVYRNGERGRLHAPEFSLLEWYRTDFDHYQLMDEVAALIAYVANRPISQQRISYQELFQVHIGIDPHQADVAMLRSCAHKLSIGGADKIDLPNRDAWLDLLLTHIIEPQLPVDKLTFVYDYPASQAALAQVRAGSPPLAERFELYLGGMELANGFHELGDAEEQKRRFMAELTWRREREQPIVPMDEYLLAALTAGLPNCAGVALGIDRLLMWLTESTDITQVLAFSFD